MSNERVQFKNYIFDLDGTLIESAAEILKCLKKATELSGYDVSKIDFSPNIIGPPIREIITNMIPDISLDKIGEIEKNFRFLYDNDTEDKTPLYKGMYEYLVHLKSQNKNLFIATMKPKIPSIRILKSLNIEEFFIDVYVIDKYDSRMNKAQMIADILKKYQLSSKDSVMFGDALSDLKAAKDNGVYSASVLWGYCNNKEKLKNLSDFVICRAEELYNV